MDREIKGYGLNLKAFTFAWGTRASLLGTSIRISITEMISILPL